jgi:prepilin peptidase CpaA
MFNSIPAGPYWGALFSVLLIAACVTDVRVRRIPNSLVVLILGCGLAWSLATRPIADALVHSAAGIGLGFAIWIGFWLAGVMGAGDVKFFAAIGAWLGPELTWRAALAAALVGGLLAIVALVQARALSPALRRLAMSLSSGTLGILGHSREGENAPRRHLPYGVALAIGSLILAWFPAVVPW